MLNETLLIQSIQTFHVMCGTVFLGLTIASYFYVLNAARKYDVELLKYALRTTFFSDLVIFFIIPIQFVTALALIHMKGLDSHTPWIVVAFIAFSLLAILWLFTLKIRLGYFRGLNVDTLGIRKSKSFHWVYIISIIIFIVIIHDAVKHQTYFQGLFAQGGRYV